MGGADRFGRSSLADRLPTLQWSPKTYLPADFPETFAKPQVVRLLPGDSEGWEGAFDVPAKRVDLGPELDTLKPMLVYSHRRRTKVFAEHVSWDKAKKSYQPHGPLLEVPKDYIGWMEVVTKDGRGRGYHGSIQSVVATGCKYFLTRTTLNGFRASDDETNGLQILGESKIYPGEVVKVVDICSKKWKLVDGTLRGLVKPETQFLKCVDLKNNELCVSLAHPGIFNPVAQKGLDKDEKVVFLINDIVKLFRFPLYVRLAFGWPPKMPGVEFSGVMRLVEVRKNETLVAYNFQDGRHAVIAEVPSDLNIRLQVLENASEVEESEAFKEAIDQCITSVYPYVVSIKAMEIPYTPGGGPPPKKRWASFGRMALPRDMLHFSRSDIYPPLEEQQMSTLSRLSFKDPERSLKGLYHMGMDSIEETSTDDAAPSGPPPPRQEDGHSRTSSNASSQLSEKLSSSLGIQDEDGALGGGADGAEGPPHPADSRARKLQEIREREAPC